MKVELHSHTMRHSACAVLTPSELLTGLIERGYGAVYLTEHDALWDEQDLVFLRHEFSQIRIFPGIERSMGPCHVLVLGAQDRAYLEIPEIGPLMDHARREGHLVVLAHPFRWEGGDKPLEMNLPPDALELRTANHDAKCAAKSMEASERLGLPLVNAGDVHSAGMMDKFWIETDRDLLEANDIRQIVMEGTYRNRQSGKT